MESKKKSALALVMALVLAFGLISPAAAAPTTEPSVSPSAAADTEDAGGALTAPLPLDGSSIDPADVAVTYPEGTSAQSTTSTLPSAVETTLTDGATGTLKLVTASKYYYRMIPGASTTNAYFLASLKSFYAGRSTTGYYYARVGTSSAVKTSATNTVQLTLSASGTDAFVAGDISSLITGDTASLFLAIFDGSSETLLYYCPTAFAVTFYMDDTSTIGNGKYISSGETAASISLNIAGQPSISDSGELQLLDSSGNMVAKTISDMNPVRVNSTSTSETRFDAVFGAYFHSSYYNCSSVYGYVYFAKKLTAGSYSIRLSEGGTSTDYPNMVTVVDAPVVSSFNSVSHNGFAPATPGGTTAYMQLSVIGAGKDDFSVSILNSSGTLVGASTASKYYQNSIYYKVALANGTFSKTEQYRVQLTYKGTGAIYYAPSSESSLYVESGFRVYDVLFNSTSKADLTLKAVNPPSGTVTLGLFTDYTFQGTPLATATVTASSSMTATFTNGTSTVPVVLDPGSYYYIAMLVSGTGYSYWNYLGGFGASYSNATVDDSSIINVGQGGFKTTDTTFEADILLSKADYGVTAVSTFSAEIVYQNDATVGTLSGALATVDVTMPNGTAGVRLTGTLALGAGAKTEGQYSLSVAIKNGSAITTASVPVSCLDATKVYASSAYQWLTSTDITGYFSGPGAAAFTSGKFSYIVKDLRGTPLYTLTPAVIKYNDTYVGLSATLPATLSPGYYSVELKYDGKTIYDYSDPTQLLFTGYYLYKEIAATPCISSYSINQVGEAFGATLDTAGVANISVSAIVFASADKTTFTPVATLPMALNSSSGLYEFTNLTGIVSGTYYDVAFVDSTGKLIGSITNVMLGKSTTTTVPVSGVSMSESTLTVGISEAHQLSAAIAPSNASNKAMSWSSDKPAVATVSSTGLVTGVAKGTATITVTTTDGGKTATCLVTVTDSVSVKSVSLDTTALSLTVGTGATPLATVLPTNATNKVVSWTSDNKAAATVNATTGAITAVAAGSAVITATTADGGKTATCDVTVGVPVTGTLSLGGATLPNTWVDLFDTTTQRSIGSAKTNASGGFTFSNIPEGMYYISAISPDAGYSTLFQGFVVTAGDKAVVLGNVAFESRYSQQATVTVSLTGGPSNPATYKQVWLTGLDTGYSATKTVTGDKTQIVLTNVPYDSWSAYRVTVYDSSNGYDGTDLMYINSDTESVSFVSVLQYTISGTVTDGGLPLANVEVMAVGPAGTTCDYTDSSGRYNIRGLSDGAYTVFLATSSGYTSVAKTVTLPGAATNIDLAASEGMTLRGLVKKSDGTTPYKAYVELMTGDGTYVTSGYSAGADGYVFDKVIGAPGTYQLKVLSIINSDYSYVQFTSAPVSIIVTQANIDSGIMTRDLSYTTQTNSADAFIGTGNLVTTDLTTVRRGSYVNMTVQYRNNSATVVSGANFKVTLPSGVSAVLDGSESFTVANLAAGASGTYKLMLYMEAPAAAVITIPVTVTLSGKTYDFGVATLDFAAITLNGPQAVSANAKFKVFGEATEDSIVKIKDADTGAVLATAVSGGRWYSADLSFATAGVHKLYAEAALPLATDAVVSALLTVDVRDSQITINTVTANGIAPTLNKKLGIYTLTTYAGPSLLGFDLPLSVTFNNGSTITSVTYHFADKEYSAALSGGAWAATLSGWSGAGLKKLTATVRTSDGRTIDYIVCYVIVLIDPSGIVTDAETGLSLQGVAVSLYEIQAGNAVLYDSASENQGENPQQTDAKGAYGWMVQPGSYRIAAHKDGYQMYVSGLDPQYSSTDGIFDVPPPQTEVNFAMTPLVPVTALSLSQNILGLSIGTSKTLLTEVAPVNATNAANAVWTSSDTTVATVTGGKVTALKVGTATITATIGSHKDTCVVTVQGGGAAVTVTVNGTKVVYNTAVAEACTAIAAVYNSNGKMLGVGVTTLTQGQSSAEIPLTVASLPTGAYTKLILLDGDKRLLGVYGGMG